MADGGKKIFEVILVIGWTVVPDFGNRSRPGVVEIGGRGVWPETSFSTPGVEGPNTVL